MSTAAVEIIERAYAIGDGEEQWLKDIGELMGKALNLPFGVGANGLESRANGMVVRGLWGSGATPPPEPLPRTLQPRDRSAPVFSILRSRIVGTDTSAKPPEPQCLGVFEPLAHRLGVKDSLGFGLHDDCRSAGEFNRALSRSCPTAEAERRLWARVGPHIGAGFRLRSRLLAMRDNALPLGEKSRVEALSSPTGPLHEGRGEWRHASLRQVLQAAVRHADRERRPLGPRGAADPTGIWRGLVAGRWSLVDQFDTDGRRYIVASRNAPTTGSPPRGLTPAQADVVHLAVKGHSNAEIAYDLGSVASTVANQLSTACAKLGVRSRAALCSRWAVLTSLNAERFEVFGPTERIDAVVTATRSPSWMRQLSTAEQVVARDVLAGYRNAAIAERRGTAVRTVINQVASIFRKVGVHARSELVALTDPGHDAPSTP